jgi:hypothetical protein
MQEHGNEVETVNEMEFPSSVSFSVFSMSLC